jgi:hypothetical protein
MIYLSAVAGSPSSGCERFAKPQRTEGKRAVLGSGWTDIAPRVMEVRGAERDREGRAVSLRLDIATIAKIEADRIYDLILPETEGKETVTVPLPYLENVLTTGQKLEGLAPTYITRALDRLSATAKVHRFRRKAVIPKQSLAFVAAAFRKAAESAERRPS